MFNIEEELKKLPASPGVYLMHNAQDEIIYVGKAISLRNRVRQYFRESTNKTAKIQHMVSNISYFEYIVTDSELEALILECNLIKKHRPRYNTMLKDDKTYPYIKVTVYEEYPRILFSRDMKKDRSRYFGPYTSAGAVKETIELLRKIYKIRSCRKKLPEDIGKGRVCLNYHIKQCDGPCMGYISSEDYKKSVNEAIEFLSGKYDNVLKMLENKMLSASEDMEFEKAAEYRDLLNNVKAIAQKQKITSEEIMDRDVIAYASEDFDAVVQVFFIREGKLMGREHFHMSIAYMENGEQILESFIKQYYSGTPFVPKEILLPIELKEGEIISQWLSKIKGARVKILTPKKGEKEKMVELAGKNARLVLSQDRDKIKRQEEKTIGAAVELFEMLGIDSMNGLYRMEAFDISNTAGLLSVGSMIVYEKGKPKRNDYRKFKIKTVVGPDDYSSMREVLTRRFLHGMEEREMLNEEDLNFGKFSNFPELILMDGGMGQVNIALEVLEELKINIPVCGMVKDDHHRTRGLYYNGKELPIDTHGEMFKLITRVQDEAHRFAIEFHRNLRGKNQIKSILDDITGIGQVRRKALMKHFKSIEDIRNATVEELKEVPAMNEEAAENVYNFFHKKEN
ncbi:MAG: excinuclease ABC subunit UvrC [Lachnospiraceae bacterium]|nr:excinuclease ABC subunit UvrC [Lachnospiraceae bacterium]